MHPAHTWTYSAYHTAAVANFTVAVAAEVRRQEEALDEVSQRLRAEKSVSDAAAIAGLRKRYPVDSALYHESVKHYLADSEKMLLDEVALWEERLPFASEGVDLEVALGIYRLRTTLLRHVARIEAERRATAVAASDGTSSAMSLAPARPPPPSLLLLDAPDKVEDGHNAAPPSARAVLQLKQEVVDVVETEAQEPRSAAAVTPSLLAQIKQEASASPNSAFPPSWTPLKPEGGPVVLTDGDNGAYLTPHPTAPGAPFPRYASAPAPLAFVIATQAARPARVTGKSSLAHTQASSSSQHSRPRSSHVDAVVMQPGTQTPSSSPPPHAPGSEAATDRVMDLWWQLWPRPQRQADHSNRDDCHDENRGASAARQQRQRLRPTVAMAKAVATVVLKSLERRRARCAAQQARVAELLEESAPPTKRQRAEGARGKAGSQTSTAAAKTELLEVQQQLSDEMRQLEYWHAKQENIAQELLEALKSSPPQPRLNSSNGIDGGEVELLRDPSALRSQRTRRSASQRRRSGRNTSQRPTETIAAVASQASISASHDNLSDPKVVAADQRELLHASLRNPRRLLVGLGDIRGADSEWSTTRPDESVFHSAEGEVVEIELPSVEDDRQASDLGRYMWPTELEGGIRHALYGYTDSRGRARHGYHLPLLPEEVRRLEVSCGAAGVEDRVSPSAFVGDAEAVGQADLLSVLSRTLDSRVVELPSAGTNGWLSVHGRGEIVVKKLKLN